MSAQNTHRSLCLYDARTCLPMDVALGLACCRKPGLSLKKLDERQEQMSLPGNLRSVLVSLSSERP